MQFEREIISILGLSLSSGWKMKLMNWIMDLGSHGLYRENCKLDRVTRIEILNYYYVYELEYE